MSESNYEKLFGTPERAARTWIKFSGGIYRCADCPICNDERGVTCEIPGLCAWEDEEGGYAALLEWLSGERMNERLYTWYYLCDTCKYADSDGAGHFMCTDYAPPEYDGEVFGPIGDKLPILDFKEPHELCLSWKAWGDAE